MQCRYVGPTLSKNKGFCQQLLVCPGCHLEIVRGGKTIVIYKKGATKGLDLKNNTTATLTREGQNK